MSRASRILVVDDDPTLRNTLGEVLHDEGHEVRLAANGKEALDALARWRADLVILDIAMPVMDAFAFRRVQRERDRTESAPVLIVSAVSNLDAAAARLDAAGRLSKPFHLSRLLDEVGRILHRTRPGRAGADGRSPASRAADGTPPAQHADMTIEPPTDPTPQPPERQPTPDEPPPGAPPPEFPPQPEFPPEDEPTPLPPREPGDRAPMRMPSESPDVETEL